MQERRTYCKRLQRKANNEEMKDSGEIGRGRRQEKRAGFW